MTKTANVGRQFMEIMKDYMERQEYDSFDAYQVLCFMVENKPMTGTHSYGFHTRYGRSIREHFSFIYGTQ